MAAGTAGTVQLMPVTFGNLRPAPTPLRPDCPPARPPPLIFWPPCGRVGLPGGIYCPRNRSEIGKPFGAVRRRRQQQQQQQQQQRGRKGGLLSPGAFGGRLQHRRPSASRPSAAPAELKGLGSLWRERDGDTARRGEGGGGCSGRGERRVEEGRASLNLTKRAKKGYPAL